MTICTFIELGKWYQYISVLLPIKIQASLQYGRTCLVLRTNLAAAPVGGGMIENRLITQVAFIYSEFNDSFKVNYST